MNGHELLALLQSMDEEQLNATIYVPHHQTYDSDAGWAEAKELRTHIPAPWTGKPLYLTLRHRHGSEGEAMEP